MRDGGGKMRVLIIPDIHLKSKMLKEADKLLKKDRFLRAVCLGDYWDEFGSVTQDYYDFAEDLKKFAKKYRNRCDFLIGNHDYAYMFYDHIKCSGQNWFVFDLIKETMQEIKANKTELLIDRVLFSHAGVLKQWWETEDKELWNDFSPIWHRPAYNSNIEEYVEEDSLLLDENIKMQVAGHTPVKHATFTNNILFVDTFSCVKLDSIIGLPLEFGESRFIIIDTESLEWKKV